MSAIRVLIVDDSVVMRRILSDAIATDPSLSVAGTAPDGRIALTRVAQGIADVIILDLEMPGMDGLATLAAIRRTHPQLPVIIFSALSERGAAVTLDALSLGAADYVTKPSGAASGTEAMERIRGELIPLIKSLAPGARAGKRDAGRDRGETPTPSAEPIAAPSPRRPAARVEVVAIGASTGGPALLSRLLPRLEARFPAPIVIVQHMPSLFLLPFAARLASLSAIGVAQGAAGDILVPGRAWIAPGDLHMEVQQSGGVRRIAISGEAPRSSCRPSVDVLFESVARAYGPGALAVVLTGMGRDGLRGCERIREVGGQVLVQDESSSVVWGMPGAVARAGLADAIVPAAELPAELQRRVMAGRPVPAASCCPERDR
jgi:two-component system chemotaxis response regulator CheB